MLLKIVPDSKPVKVEHESTPSYVDTIREASYRCVINVRSPRRKKPKARGKNRLEGKERHLERTKAIAKADWL